MKNYLVTGGAGFIGSHVIERLLRSRRCSVTCIDDFNDFYSPALKRYNIEPFTENERFRLKEGDIRDLDFLNKIFSGKEFDTVIHFAARAGVRPSLKEPLLYEDVNVRGTLNLLEMCRKRNIGGFMFASSSSVYGNNEKVPFSEEDRVDSPASPYAATKKAGELMCYNYHHLYGMDVTCLRFFTVYGPSQRPEMAINKFTRLIDRGEPIPVYGDGSSRRDYTFIKDIVDGVERALDKMDGFRVYNLGESNTVGLNEMIDLIAELTGKDVKIKRRPGNPADMDITFADISRAKSELGYDPRTDFEDGMKFFIEWYYSEGKDLYVRSF